MSQQNGAIKLLANTKHSVVTMYVCMTWTSDWETFILPTCVPRMKLSSLRSPILKMRQSFLFLSVITAWLLKMTVFCLSWGLESFEKTRPTMKAWMRQPITDWNGFFKCLKFWILNPILLTENRRKLVLRKRWFIVSLRHAALLPGVTEIWKVSLSPSQRILEINKQILTVRHFLHKSKEAVLWS